MAALTETNRHDFIIGNARMVTATLAGTISDDDTWATGLNTVVYAIFSVAEDAAAADAVTCSTTLPSSSGSIAVKVDGTVATIHGLAIGF